MTTCDINNDAYYNSRGTVHIPTALMTFTYTIIWTKPTIKEKYMSVVAKHFTSHTTQAEYTVSSEFTYTPLQ